jgi:uncharacterized protein
MTAVETIREHVLIACQSDENAFGPAFFEQHLLVVREYGLKLAAVFSADAEIVELAAYMHDLAAIGDITLIPKHHLLGADVARELLAEIHYPADRIERVARCIAAHSAPVQIGAGAAEEVCVSNADAMSQIVRPVYWLNYVFGVRRFDFEAGRGWYRQRLDSNWSQLIPQARAMIEPDYRFTHDLLNRAG